MSRPVDATVLTETIKQSVFPFYICKLEFDTVAYVSSGPEVPYSGENYLADTLEVGPMSWSDTGVQKAEITLPDDGLGSALQLALSGSLADIPATLWLVYRTPVDTFTTPVMLVKGVLNPLDITLDAVKLEILAVSIDAEYFPDQYCTADNGFNYLPKEGQIVDWGDEKFELVTDDG